jgi:hypothetical protein
MTAHHQYGMQSGPHVSNRHPCRLEMTVSPCAPTKPLLLIVTQSPLFCAQLPTTKRAPAALALCLRVSVAEVQPLTSNIEPLIPNRNIPLLDTSLSSLKQRTSFFLIATQHPWGLPVSPGIQGSRVDGESSSGDQPSLEDQSPPSFDGESSLGGSDAAQPGLFFVSQRLSGRDSPRCLRP